MKRILQTLLISLAAWFLVACSAQTGGLNDGDRGPSGYSGPEPTVPAGAQEAVATAKRDLSERTGKPAEQLFLISIDEVEWRDSSLGCPEPGKFYAQVITPGYRITLSDGTRQYEYHSDKRGRVTICEGGR